ncbi:hypothetical protein OW763_13900 [Clostridium aestuarii]|uniref:CopG family transcriptional regulator n=1 Tax=Clostridium aestuarii TaxID=338193 RepID=A0ABT4D2G7_9CLOT|nr:hypothetical protein [Clostridium aestuarii]MCY6485424.1 hypothetical protein [Clostridium aestuarii]
MAKKSDNTNIKNLGKGILDTLTSINEEKSKKVKDEKNNTVNTPKSTTVSDKKSKRVNIENSKLINTQNNNTIKEENNKSVNKEKSKDSKEKKSKRSFMLKEKSIQKLNMLNMALNDKDLSTIVDEAINLYFEENKGNIEDLISRYNALK